MMQDFTAVPAVVDLAAMRGAIQRAGPTRPAEREYGSGSARDWAAKGPAPGVKPVIAGSYERIHRSNLVCMDILPLQFQDESAGSLGLTAKSRSPSAASRAVSRRVILDMALRELLEASPPA